MSEDFLQMKGIYKHFGGTYVLDNVDFSARSGEIHALMGENGAGKSTLMKILSGVYKKDAGEILIDGKEEQINDPHQAKELGISIIYQEFALANDLTVAENIFIDRLDRFINWKELNDRAQKLLDELGFSDINPRSRINDISVAYQQVVEICKALSRNSRILIFDEPTAVLTSNEVEKFFRLIKQLRENNVCIIYISHRLNEIYELCDRITVLKDGSMVATVNTKDIGQNELVKLMIGRELSEMVPPKTAEIGEVVLQVENLSIPHLVKNVSFTARAGEILGISGLVGAGRTETMQGVFGSRRRSEGRILLDGKELHINSPKQAVEYGIGMLSEDRKGEGVLLDLPISVNATLAALRTYLKPGGVIDFAKEREDVTQNAGFLLLKMSGIGQKAGDLSGGNQQKVALMKWILAKSRVLILDEPTRGVDVGAKTEIYKIMDQLAAQGVAIIMISSEMPEIIGMSDRALVMREGTIRGELQKQDINELNLINLSMGVQG